MKPPKRLSLRTVPVLSYLANSINSGERSTPYSLVTALDDETLAKLRKSRSRKRRSIRRSFSTSGPRAISMRSPATQSRSNIISGMKTADSKRRRLTSS